jgi:hypothetical protein
MTKSRNDAPAMRHYGGAERDSGIDAYEAGANYINDHVSEAFERKEG